MKNFKFKGLIFVLIAFLLLWFILKDNYRQIIDVLLNADIVYILLGIFLFFLYFLLESFVLYKLTNQYKSDYKFKNAFILNLMTKFFNGITPFASGGQPLQVYEFNKDGVKSSYATLIVVEHFLLFQTSIVFLAFLSLLINFLKNILTFNSLLLKFTIIGFTLNIGLLLIVYIICLNNKFCKKIGLFVIKLLNKIKIIKDKNIASLSWERTCNEYYNGFIELKKNKLFIFKVFLFETLALILMLLVPYFTFLSLGVNINIISLFVLSTYVFFVGSFFPVPGGSGGTEYAFVIFFLSFASESVIGVSLILWRFITYYLPVIIGGIVFSLRKVKDK